MYESIFDSVFSYLNPISRHCHNITNVYVIVSKGMSENLINDGTTSFFRACVLSEISTCIVNRQQQQNVQCNHSNNMSRKKNVPYDINDNNVGEHPKIKKKCFVMACFMKFNAINVLFPCLPRLGFIPRPLLFSSRNKRN